MVQKKHKSTLDLVSTRNNMEQLKELAVSLGMPYTYVRRVDDALMVVGKVEARMANVKQEA
jgi:hypothetical protein